MMSGPHFSINGMLLVWTPVGVMFAADDQALRVVADAWVAAGSLRPQPAHIRLMLLPILNPAARNSNQRAQIVARYCNLTGK